ncbi:uncharacterized protein LOC120303927 isoform X1 [Crotalus tigris]|uniref:uncharacterized protein LOC120303927 isoform X1 n=1 Tax=Crotalus tigris TaxID=88082 RepID=UPI00192F8F9C|nr:uncharacterized protein LOC120303927 isoform X1 [Crotalus tigris]
MAAAARRVPLGREAHGVYSLCFGASGAQLAAGFGDGAVQLVDAGTGAPGPCLRPGRRPRHAVTALGFHRAKPGLLLAAGADGVVVLYDLSAGGAAASLSEEENEIHALDFCRDGSAFATAGKDRHIRLYDSQTHQLVHVVRAPDFMAGDEFTPFSGHSRRIFALRFHPTELHLFLTGGWDNSVKVWDKRVPKGAQSVINGPHICGPGIDIKPRRDELSWHRHVPGKDALFCLAGGREAKSSRAIGPVPRRLSVASGEQGGKGFVLLLAFERGQTSRGFSRHHSAERRGVWKADQALGSHSGKTTRTETDKSHQFGHLSEFHHLHLIVGFLPPTKSSFSQEAHLAGAGCPEALKRS